jgi:O-acetyl-ADP-ribose deacetylase (regulator of RNase III)
LNSTGTKTDENFSGQTCVAEMLRLLLAEGPSILMLVGDITEQQTDAIVNAANSTLLGGMGVDGAIHAAGGPAILAECMKFVEMHGQLPPGDAVATTAGKMKAGYVIHTVGPIYHEDETGAPKVLARAYTTSLAVAERMHLHTLAFPAISTGAYGYPVSDAAVVAINATVKALRNGLHVHEVRFVFLHESIYNVYAHAAEELARQTQSITLQKLQGLITDHA